MENFQTSVELFLKEVQKFWGDNPTFKIDYRKESIILTDAPSGFLRQLYANDRVLAHLSVDGLHISFLED